MKMQVKKIILFFFLKKFCQFAKTSYLCTQTNNIINSKNLLT